MRIKVVVGNQYYGPKNYVTDRYSMFDNESKVVSSTNDLGLREQNIVF